MKLFGALGIVYVVWGSTYLAIEVADRSMPPFLMLAVRFLLAGAALYAWARRRGAPKPTAREWRAAGLVGFALLVLDTGGVAWAEQRVASGTTALIIASVPLFVALLDRIFFGVRMPVLGILVGLFGVGLLVGPSGHVDLAGGIVLLFASFIWAAGSAYARVAPLPSSNLLSAAMQMLTAGAALSIVSVASGERPSAPSAAGIGAFLFLVVFGSIVAFSAYGWLLQHASSTVVSTYAYVNPAVAVLLGWLFVGERLGPREIAAGLVVLASVGLLALRRAPAAEVVELPRAPQARDASQLAA